LIRGDDAWKDSFGYDRGKLVLESVSTRWTRGDVEGLGGSPLEDEEEDAEAVAECREIGLGRLVLLGEELVD